MVPVGGAHVAGFLKRICKEKNGVSAICTGPDGCCGHLLCMRLGLVWTAALVKQVICWVSNG